MLRKLSVVAALWCLSLAPSLAIADALVDVAGRSVVVPHRVERVILGEGRYIPILAILDREDPLQRVVGQLGEFQRTDPGGYAEYLAKFPKLAAIHLIGHTSSDTFSIEEALALRPDVAIFGIEGHGPSSKEAEVISRLEAAGVAVVFVDFRREPLVNTPKSISLLGKLFGREEQAAEFVTYYNEQLKLVVDRLAKASERRPTVFLESRVGFSEECCSTMVNGMMGRFVDWAGGQNIAKGLIPGVSGAISVEYLLTHQPDVYIGTAVGAPSAKQPHRIALGAGVSKERALVSLRQSLTRTGIADLNAVADKRAFAIWHNFYNSPFNVVAVQAFAKWLHPKLFADLDPDATLATLYARFQPVPLSGTYWVDLE